jgi:prepilin-type N-terminal cleavage/methylation domain-containing protein
MARQSDRGFTMLELVAAMFVLAVGLLGTLQMYNVLAEKMLHLQESEIAARALNTEIETLRARPFSQLTDRENAAFVSQPYGAENLVNLTTRLTIQPHPDARLKLKQVTATILWTGEHGRRIEKSITTLIADKEAG